MGASQDVLKALLKVAEEIVGGIGIGILDKLVEANPVDTHHSQNNWVPSVGTPFTGIDGSRNAPSSAAQSKGRREISSYRLSEGALFITNNVPYLIYLAYGHSKQAATGWDLAAVESGIAEGIRELMQRP